MVVTAPKRRKAPRRGQNSAYGSLRSFLMNKLLLVGQVLTKLDDVSDQKLRLACRMQG
jgi:hypothetical protein